MTPVLHSCDYCRTGKARPALVLLLARSPNITSTRAAARLGFTRAYVTALRLRLEKHGCVPKRTVDGRAQGHVERAQTHASASSGFPIAHTLPGELDELIRSHRPAIVWGYSIGSWRSGSVAAGQRP